MKNKNNIIAQLCQPNFLCFLLGALVLGSLLFLAWLWKNDQYKKGYEAGQIDYAAGKRCVKLSKNERGEVVYTLLDSCEYKGGSK
jgi:hypothetical protein